MKPNFRWKKSNLCADNAWTSNEALLSESLLSHGENHVATSNIIVANSGLPHHVAQLVKDPESEGRKPMCFCGSPVIKKRTRQGNSWCILKNIFNWRPDWRGSFVFVVIVVCLLSRTTLGAMNSDSGTYDGDDQVIFNARRLTSLTEPDSIDFLNKEYINTDGITGSDAESGTIPCGNNKEVHVKIQYSTSIVENGNVFLVITVTYLIIFLCHYLKTYLLIFHFIVIFA